MTITSQDVKLFKSQVMADTPDGGGRMTGNEVVDGELNNVFDDTSRDDRVNGRVSLRKIFGAVLTSTTDKYLGAHTIVTDPPDDGRVSVAILDLVDHADRRDAVREFVEKYLVAGPTTTMTLYDLQPAGARTIAAYQHVDDPLPEVSDVLCLSVELTTHVSYGHQQFVRISDMTVERINIGSTANPEYINFLTLEISEPLEISYPGGDIKVNPLLSDKPTRIRKCDLNSAANYYGVMPLAEDVSVGDVTIKADSILQPIVPSSYSESPILDQQLGPETVSVIPAGPSYTETLTATASAAGTATATLPRGCAPDSLTVVATTSDSAWNATLEDAGAGSLSRTSGGASTTNAAGTIVAASGAITITGLKPSGSYTLAATYVPSAATPDVAHTTGTLITLANRGFNYSFSLIPKPAPGSVTVTFRSLGRWYTLQDNGIGQLVGAAGVGAGTVNPLTGTVNATLGYQPDVGSRVLVGWRTAAHYLDRSDYADTLVGAIRMSTDEAIKPGSLTVSWTHSSVTYTATDDGGGGFTGDLGDGWIDYSGKEFQFTPAVVPAKLSTISISYLSLAQEIHTPSPQPTPGTTTVAFTLPNAPIEPGTAVVRVSYSNAGNFKILTFVDNGSNVLQVDVGGTLQDKGTINYSTGEVVIDKEISI